MADILFSHRKDILDNLINSIWHTEEIQSKRSFGIVIILDLLRYGNYIILLKTYKIRGEYVSTNAFILVKSNSKSYKEFKLQSESHDRDTIISEIGTKLHPLISKIKKITSNDTNLYSYVEYNNTYIYVPKDHYLIGVTV